MIRNALAFVALAVLLASPAAASRQAHRSAVRETSDFQHDVKLYPEALLAAGRIMAGSGIKASAHVYTTDLRAKNSGDNERAREILDILRKSMDRYKDYKVAVADGYHVFMPKTQQPLYWFINDRNAYLSAFAFNPGHPTSLLYKKTRSGYELQGALFTAPKNATGTQLNARIPLSSARWHEHVNLCVQGKRSAARQTDGKFGLNGSIATKGKCAAVGGRWVPQVFGWMVTVFPFQSDTSRIWPH